MLTYSAAGTHLACSPKDFPAWPLSIYQHGNVYRIWRCAGPAPGTIICRDQLPILNVRTNACAVSVVEHVHRVWQPDRRGGVPHRDHPGDRPSADRSVKRVPRAGIERLPGHRGRTLPAQLIKAFLPVDHAALAATAALIAEYSPIVGLDMTSGNNDPPGQPLARLSPSTRLVLRW
jgi:hypothetical protein